MLCQTRSFVGGCGNRGKIRLEDNRQQAENIKLILERIMRVVIAFRHN